MRVDSPSADVSRALEFAQLVEVGMIIWVRFGYARHVASEAVAGLEM